MIELLDHIQREKLPTAIITRNSQETAQHILNKHSLNFDIVISREDTPPKPDPTQLNNLVSRFNLDPKQCLYIGDMSFDLDFARNAGVKSGLYVRPNNHSIKNKADIVISCYDQFLIGQRAL